MVGCCEDVVSAEEVRKELKRDGFIPGTKAFRAELAWRFHARDLNACVRRMDAGQPHMPKDYNKNGTLISQTTG